VFDACFHDVIPSWPVWRQDLGAGNPGTVDPASWSAAQAPAAAAISDAGNARRMEQVLAVTRAPIDRADPSTVQRTALGLLWYSFRGTQDAIAKLNGLAYANLDRSYSGSLDDAALNAGVERFRFTADPSRLATLQTMARLRRPLVTIHTTGDPIVPIWQQELYKHRLPLFSRLLFTPISIQRYGHGNFTDAEILAAFAVLVLRVTGANLVASQSVLPSPAARAQCLEFAARYGAHPILEPGPVSRVSERGAHERMAAQSGTLSH
jgi:hypothetical protein